MSAKKKTGVELPGPIPEDGYPAGDGPLWISVAVGAPGSLSDVSRFLSDEGEQTSLVLHFVKGIELVIRPARMVTTRRLSELLGALGFPVPFYSPPQLARLGQAVGRVADRALEDEQERLLVETASIVGGWLDDCLRPRPIPGWRGQEEETVNGYVLRGRDGKDVRAAIDYVRRGFPGGMAGDDRRGPLIVEPKRGVLLAWTVPVRAVIRDRMGTTPDGDVGLRLKRSGLTRSRLAARAAVGGSGIHELPVWVVYNGWQGINVQMPDADRDCGPLKLCLL